MLANIEALKDRAYKLETIAIDYHTNMSRCMKSEQDIKLQIQRLAQYIEVHQILSDPARINNVKAIRRTITLNNFESEGHRALKHSNSVIRKIHNAFTDLIDICEKEYRASYPLRKKGFWKRLISND